MVVHAYNSDTQDVEAAESVKVIVSFLSPRPAWATRDTASPKQQQKTKLFDFLGLF